MEKTINFDDFAVRNKIISSSGGSGSIKCSRIDNIDIILKKYPDNKKHKYYKEKEIYLKLKNEYYVPKLMYYDDNTYILIIEDCGDSMDSIISNNHRHLVPRDLVMQIELIIKGMYYKYSLLHGDLHFGNICVKHNKIFLIDFESVKKLDIKTYDYKNSSLKEQILHLIDTRYIHEFVINEINKINKRPWQYRKKYFNKICY